MGYIVYGGQGSDIVSFMTETRMTLNNLGVLIVDVYAGIWLDLYGGEIGLFDIGIQHFLIKMRCCPEVILQARAGVGTVFVSHK